MRYKQYRDAYEAAISELESLLVKQEKLEERVLSLRKTLNVLSELCQQDGVAETDADRRYARLAKAVEGSLTDDIRKIMQSTIDGLTANEVREELNKLGNTLAEHSNPLATVSAVLNRLLVNGEVEEGLKDGKKAWKSRTLRLSALTKVPRGKYQGRYSGNRLNSDRFSKGST
jgi:hypothetical protein